MSRSCPHAWKGGSSQSSGRGRAGTISIPCLNGARSTWQPPARRRSRSRGWTNTGRSSGSRRAPPPRELGTPSSPAMKSSTSRMDRRERSSWSGRPGAVETERAMTRVTSGRGAVLFIFITVLVDTIGLGIILPVLPELIMELTGEGLSRASIYGGWVWFIYAPVQFFCAPPLRNLSDRFGRRPVILFSLLALGLDYLIMGLAPTIAWLFVGRTVSGIPGASYSPAYAHLSDIRPPENRAPTFDVTSAGFWVGLVIGPRNSV